MPPSTLDPDSFPESDRQLGRAHGINALGPSDMSDSGSDVQGGYRAIDEPEFGLGLDRGTNEDSDGHVISASSDTDDLDGTGESSMAGGDDDIELGGDIGVDRIEEIDALPEDDFDR